VSNTDNPTFRDGLVTLVMATVTAVIMIAHHVAGKATRDALFLTVFDIDKLPKMMAFSAALSVISVLTMSRVLSRQGPAWLIPRIFALSSILFCGEWFMMAYQPKLIVVILYLHITVFGAILISGFWSVINERFDPYTAKTTIARLAAAATLGGLLGGFAAKFVSGYSDTRSVLLMLSMMHCICAISLWVVTCGGVARQQNKEPMGFILTPLKTNGLIRRMAFLVVLVAIIVALLDYLMKSKAASTLSDEELISFFSYFYMGIGVGGFLLQSSAGEKALKRFGLGGTMAVLPLTVMAGGMLALVVKQLLTVTLLRGGTALLINSFYRAGFETLYTPISANDKRSTKVLIDVGIERSGEMLGSLLIMGILLLPISPDIVLPILSMILAGLSLIVIYMLHQGYVHQLVDNLRNGTLSAAEISTVDVTTQRTLALTKTAIERDKLLEAISQLRHETKAEKPPEKITSLAVDLDPGFKAILELQSEDDGRIVAALLAQPLTPMLVPHVIPLLAKQQVLQDVFSALRPVTSTCTGQLMDALLDQQQHPIIRRRLPLVLGLAENQRAVNGLIEGLSDLDWNVRFRCGQALLKLKINHPNLNFPHIELHDLVLQELDSSGKKTFPVENKQATDIEEPNWLNHVFHLLGLMYNPDVLELCYQAISTKHRDSTGTALEYLENLLPSELRDALWPHIGLDRTSKKTNRPAAEIADELLKAAPNLKTKNMGSTDIPISDL